MAKVKYDVSNAEVRNFEVPKPGVYSAKIHEMSHGDSSSGNPMFTIVFEITSGEHKGSRIWHYILTDGSQEWRLREFTDAVGLKPKGTIDTDELTGKVVSIKTAIDPARDGYDEKARIKNVLASTNGASSEASEDDDEPYEEWNIADLREEVEARELEITGKKTKKKLVDALNADDASDEEDEDEEDDEPEDESDEDEITMSDLEEMSRTELKKLIQEEELEVKVTKKTSDEDLRTKIAEALEIEADEEDEDEEEGDDEEEAEDYSEWDIADLKKELKERGLKTDGRKTILVKRLEKDDESGDDEPF